MLEELKQKYGSQANIAKALGVSQMTVSKWYSGKTFPSRVTATKIAKDLSISLPEVYLNVKPIKEA